jgi:hypothetical protein
MEMVVGIKLEHDPVYLSKREIHMPDGTDDLIGFNPNCINSVKPIVKVVDYSLNQVTGNDWRKHYKHVSSN